MNIADMIKLSVGGYTKDQIKEMNTLTKECPELLDFATKQGKTFDEVKELFDGFHKLVEKACDADLVELAKHLPTGGAVRDKL